MSTPPSDVPAIQAMKARAQHKTDEAHQEKLHELFEAAAQQRSHPPRYRRMETSTGSSSGEETSTNGSLSACAERALHVNTCFPETFTSGAKRASDAQMRIKHKPAPLQIPDPSGAASLGQTDNPAQDLPPTPKRGFPVQLPVQTQHNKTE